MNNWDSYEKSAKKGPLQIGIKVILVLFILSGVIWGLGTTFSWFGEAASVAKAEFGPRELLRKYEWFKDAAAELDKKKADILVYDERIKSLNSDYVGIGRKDWPRTDREQMSIWQAEASGVKASYNGLAAEYNAQMSKFNWRFTNAGDLPEGASTPLPKEFKTYTEN